MKYIHLVLAIGVLWPGCDRRGGARGDDAGVSDQCADPTECAYPSRDLELRAPLTGLAIVDERTGRAVPVVVRAPRTGGPYPVVLFEHGGGLRDDGHTDEVAWGTLIASHGYVVVHVGHPPTNPTTYAAICREAGTTIEECMATPPTIHTVARVLDLTAVLDDLETIADALEEAGGPRVQRDRIGLAGWSGGTHGPTTLFGATRSLSPTVPRYAHPDARPRVAVLMSPSGPGFHQFFEAGSDHSWSSLRGPTLMLTGENDEKHDEGMSGPIRREAFDLAPADGTHHLLYSTLPLGVGGHGTYDLVDRASSDPRLRRLSAAIASLALAFLDAYLKDDAAAIEYVASDRARQLAGDATYEAR